MNTQGPVYTHYKLYNQGITDLIHDQFTRVENGEGKLCGGGDEHPDDELEDRETKALEAVCWGTKEARQMC
jgi:hypothetical protein